MIQTKSKQSIAKRVPLKGPLHNTKNQYPQIAISSQGKIELINTEEIVYLKSDGNYTKIHLADGRCLTTATTLKKYQDKLKAPTFMRVHNSYIIHRAHLKTYLHQEQKIMLKNNQEIPVSRSKKEGLMRYLKMLMVSMIFFCCSFNASAQTFVEWHAPLTSDWSLPIAWEVTTNIVCDCSDNTDYFEFRNPTQLSQIYQTVSRSHTTSNFGGATYFDLGPEASLSIRGTMRLGNALVNDPIFGPCGISCPGSFFSSPSDLTLTTDPLRPPANVTHTLNPDGTVTFNWTVTTDMPEPFYSLRYGWEGDDSGEITNKSVTSLTACPPSDNSLMTFYTKKVNDGFESTKVDIIITEGPRDDGKISGTIKTISGTGVQNVIVKATLTNPGIFGCPNQTVFTSEPSQQSGGYNIPGIIYHSSVGPAIYDVTAELAGHSFRLTPDALSNDSIRTYNLTTNSHIFSGADFYDVNTYDVTGYVKVDGNCGLDDVAITATGPGSSVTTAQTSGDGSFALIVTEQGNYTVVSEHQGMPFDTFMVNVQDNLVLPNILYNKKDTIRGYSGAGCFEAIGQMTIQARTLTGCTISSAVTNSSGFYELIVPTIPMEVQAVAYDPQDSGLDQNVVLNAIDSVYQLNFDSTTTLNIQYRKPIVVNVEGLPPPPCPSVIYPVLNQDQVYSISINIWESLNICRADTGKVTISDDASTFGIQDPLLTSNVPFSNGRLRYTFKAGEPALSAPYLKYINITAFVDNEVYNLSIPVIVSGTRNRTSTLTLAPSDSIPFMILRDPPGDGSYAVFEESNTTTYAQSFSHEVAGSVKLWGKAKSSIFGVVWGEIAGSLEVGGSRNTATETTVTLETTSQIKTKGTNAFIGEDGDLIMGAAVIFKYGLSDDRYFDLNTCSIVVDTSLLFSPDNFEATYRRSVYQIKTKIIPNLEFLSQNQSLPAEERRKFAGNLRMWEQILQLNRDLKEDALKDSEQYFSFDAGGEATSTYTGSSSRKATLEFTTTIDANIALSAGVKTTSFEGSFGVDVNIQSIWGSSNDTTTAESTTTGYHYSDDDPDDDHTFKYAIDSVYGTPVFEVVGGASSCPHEDNTQFIDLMKLTIADPIFIGAQGEVYADFPYTIQNLGETNITNDYILEYSPTPNFTGVEIRLNSVLATSIPISNLAPGAIREGTIRVTRLPGDSYAFEGLEFNCFAACLAGGNPNPDRSIKSTASVSAFFYNSCSNINLTAPNNDWLINQQTGDSLEIEMAEYTPGSIDNIKLMYANLKDGTWTASNINIAAGNIQPSPRQYNWDVSNLPDGEYVIRWELTCGTTTNWSPRITGKIDRSPPRVFGVEKPVDDIYYPGDEISVQFNEDIDFSLLTNNHIYLKAIPEGTMHPVLLKGSGNKVILVPDGDISSMYNQTFEVGVFGIFDLYGNEKTDTAIWEFVIIEPDSDRDGIPDTKDRCPGGDDNRDTDMDGLPDDCDCVPTIPTNGRGLTKAALNFDGVNDYLRIPYNPGLIPTSTNATTFETWIFPNETNNGVGIITQNGTFPNQTNQIYLDNTSQKITINRGGVLLISMDTIAHNEWTHIAVVYNLNEIRLYLNGELDNTKFQTLPSIGLPFELTIGNQESGGPASWNWDGSMDEMRYWNYARTQSEIQADLNKELIGTESGLLAHFPFNEGTPFGDNTDLALIFDNSPNSYFGYMIEFEKTGNKSNWINSPMSLLNLAYDVCRTCQDTLNAAMDFDGSNDRIEISNHASLLPSSSSSMTFETWVNPAAYPAIIASSIDGIYLALSSIGNIQVLTNSFVSGPVVPKNKWTHIAYAFDSNGLNLYINGEFIAYFTMTHNLTNPGNAIGLGGNIDDENYMMDGRMDDIRFWDYTRTAEEIKDHLYTELEGNETGLAAYYNFNNGVPNEENEDLTLIPDVSGNGHDAIPVNFYQFGMFSNWVKSPLRFAIDVDEDGRPDACDSCIPPSTLTLDNTTLSGIYRAKDKIILGNNLTIPISETIYLRAPEIEVLNQINAPSSTKIYVSDKPCNE